MTQPVSHEPPLDVDTIRSDFPILNQTIHGGRPLIYFDNGASTQRPSVVIDRMAEVYQQSYANVHRGIHWLSEQSTSHYEAARSAVARFIGAQNEREVIFTAGTTLSINLVARALGDVTGDQQIQSCDEILLTEMEHHSNIVPWQQLAKRTGATIRFVPVDDDGKLELSSLDNLLTERTRIFAFTAVSNVLGTINPVRQLVSRAREVNAITVIDAAQHVPHDLTDITQWDADFVAFSPHKMLGPSGLGILYGKMQRLEPLPAFLGGGSMISSVTLEGHVEGLVPARFEAGTPPIAQAITFPSALRYLEDIGMARIKQHEQELARHAIQQLTERIDGLRVFGPPESSPYERAGIVSFVVDGCSTQDLSLLLDRKGIAIRAGHHCAMPLHEKLGVASSCRASFYLYNSADEIDTFVEHLQAIVKKLRG